MGSFDRAISRVNDLCGRILELKCCNDRARLLHRRKASQEYKHESEIIGTRLCLVVFDERRCQRARDTNGRTYGTRHGSPRQSSADVLRTFPLAPRPGASRRIVMARWPLVARSAGKPARLVVECWPELVLVSGCRLPLPGPLHSTLPSLRLLVLVRFLPKLL